MARHVVQCRSVATRQVCEGRSVFRKDHRTAVFGKRDRRNRGHRSRRNCGRLHCKPKRAHGALDMAESLHICCRRIARIQIVNILRVPVIVIVGSKDHGWVFCGVLMGSRCNQPLVQAGRQVGPRCCNGLRNDG